MSVNSFAAGSASQDKFARIATDRNGTWLTVWASNSQGLGSGRDQDVFFSVSTDRGLSWSPASTVNTNANAAAAFDGFPVVADAGNGAWFAAWHSRNDVGGAIGRDEDVLYAYSYGGGLGWTTAAPLHDSATIDSEKDQFPVVASDRNGTIVTTWQSAHSLNGAIGTDTDLVSAVELCVCEN